MFYIYSHTQLVHKQDIGPVTSELLLQFSYLMLQNSTSVFHASTRNFDEELSLLPYHSNLFQN